MKQIVTLCLLIAVFLVGVFVVQRNDLISAQGGDTALPVPSSREALSTEAVVAEVIAELDYDVLPEASGLGVSGFDPERLWFINDSGSRSELVALNLAEARFRRLNVLDTPNKDWEDLETFDYRGTPWILIADVGDNNGRRKAVTLYLLPEPTAKERKVRIKTTISLTYPDGPRDVESVAVDPYTETVYLLSKRDPFPKLYALPLPILGEQQEFVVKPVLLGEVRSIPAPSQEDLVRFPKHGKYRAQPTAMAHVPDGSGIVLLTYGGSYFALLGAQRDWLDALNGGLCEIPRPELKQAESITADARGRVYLSSEGRKAPVLRLKPSAECLSAGDPG